LRAGMLRKSGYESIKVKPDFRLGQFPWRKCFERQPPRHACDAAGYPRNVLAALDFTDQGRGSGRELDALVRIAIQRSAAACQMIYLEPVQLGRASTSRSLTRFNKADQFGVSKERLSEAVRKVGHSTEAVRRELERPL